jgi:hypothetical protein
MIRICAQNSSKATLSRAQSQADSVGVHGDALDLDPGSQGETRGRKGAARRIGGLAKNSSVDLVEGRPLGDVGEHHGALHHVLRSGHWPRATVRMFSRTWRASASIPPGHEVQDPGLHAHLPRQIQRIVDAHRLRATWARRGVCNHCAADRHRAPASPRPEDPRGAGP